MKKSIVLGYWLSIAIGIFVSSVKAQSNINLVRYDDNYLHLKNDTLKKGLDRLKYISLGSRNYISVGGELREHFQVFKNINFGDVPPNYPNINPIQLNHRLMVHADLALGHFFRVFTQFNNTLRFLNDNPAVPEIDENKLSLHQAFGEFMLRDWRLRLGRQELFYGTHRLFTVREGPNTRKTFDGIVVKKKLKKGSIDLFALAPTISQPNIFDDDSFKEGVIGLYSTLYLADRKFGMDYFVVNFQSSSRKYNYQSGYENRQTYGVRFFSNLKQFNFEVEGTYQSGKFSNLRIDAYSILADINVIFAPAKKGAIGITANIASGDKNGRDDKLNTYNLLFAKPAYGLAIPVGSTNIVSLYPYLKINPVQNLNVLAQVFFLGRNSSQDGIYSPGMIENRPKPELLFSSSKKALGVFYVLEANYQHTKNLSFGLDGAWFKAGSYPSVTGKGKNITYISFKSTFRF